MHLLQIKPVVPAWKSSSAAAAQCPPRMLSNKAVSTQAHLGMPDLDTSVTAALYPYFPFFYILHLIFSPSSSFSSLTTSNLLHLFFCFVSFLGGVLRASAFCACLSLLLRFLEFNFYNLNFFLVPFVQLLINSRQYALLKDPQLGCCLGSSRSDWSRTRRTWSRLASSSGW